MLGKGLGFLICHHNSGLRSDLSPPLQYYLFCVASWTCALGALRFASTYPTVSYPEILEITGFIPALTFSGGNPAVNGSVLFQIGQLPGRWDPDVVGLQSDFLNYSIGPRGRMTGTLAGTYIIKAMLQGLTLYISPGVVHITGHNKLGHPVGTDKNNLLSFRSVILILTQS